MAASKESSSSPQSLPSASITLQSPLNIQSLNSLDPSLSSSSSSPTSIINIVSGAGGGGGGNSVDLGGGISIVGIESSTQQPVLQQQTITVSLNSIIQNQGKAQSNISGRDLPSNSGVMTGWLLFFLYSNKLIFID